MTDAAATVTIYPTGTGAYRLASTEWPTRIMVSDRFIQDNLYTRLAWPYLSIQVENGRAVYRVETLDRGAWHGALVEGSVIA